MGKELKILETAIEKVCKEHNGVLTATDTHRWVESDGFYEVQFMIKFPNSDKSEPDSGIFLHNESGGVDLENEWSKDNPREIQFSQLEKYLDDEWDINYAILQINDFLKGMENIETNGIDVNIDGYVEPPQPPKDSKSAEEFLTNEGVWNYIKEVKVSRNKLIALLQKYAASQFTAKEIEWDKMEYDLKMLWTGGRVDILQYMNTAEVESLLLKTINLLKQRLTLKP